MSESGRMKLRFYIDPETDQPHIYGLGVTEDEVREVFRGRGEDKQGARNSRLRLGQTSAGRYLKVVYETQEHLCDYRLRTQRQSETGLAPPTAKEITMSKRKQKLPPGWDDARIQEVIAHYEHQTEDE